MELLISIIIAVNLFGFLLMGYDKQKAQNKGWRVPELNLFMLAFVGGALGVFLGMRVFRHKTKHYSFMIGIPLLIGLNVIFYSLIAQKVLS